MTSIQIFCCSPLLPMHCKRRFIQTCVNCIVFVGESMMEMVSGHEQIKNHQQDWVRDLQLRNLVAKSFF